MSCYGGRNGRNTVVLAAKETEYGVLADFSAATIHSMAVACEITPVVNTTDVPQRTGTIAPQLSEVVKTTTAVTVTLSGAFNDGYEWLEEAFTGSTASPYTINDTNKPSYEIHRRHTDGTPKDDIVTGLVCKTFDKSADQNGVLMFTATFDGQAPLMEQAVEGTYVAPTIKEFQFAGSTIANENFTLSGLTSYACNLSSESMDEATAFGNSATKVCDQKTKIMGEVTHESVYLSTEPLTIGDMMEDSIEISAAFTNGSNTISIVTKGKYTAEVPDVENDFYKLSVTQTLGGTDSAEAYTVTYV
jgi:hypothetical protein